MMKTESFKKELAQMNVDELNNKLIETRKDLFALRLNSLTSHVVNYADFKKMRRNIARILTMLKDKEQESKA